jgi:hypothetical protein
VLQDNEAKTKTRKQRKVARSVKRNQTVATKKKENTKRTKQLTLLPAITSTSTSTRKGHH